MHINFFFSHDVKIITFSLPAWLHAGSYSRANTVQVMEVLAKGVCLEDVGLAVGSAWLKVLTLFMGLEIEVGWHMTLRNHTIYIVYIIIQWHVYRTSLCVYVQLSEYDIVSEHIL